MRFSAWVLGGLRSTSKNIVYRSAWLLSVSLVFPFRGHSFVILCYVQSPLDIFPYFIFGSLIPTMSYISLVLLSLFSIYALLLLSPPISSKIKQNNSRYLIPLAHPTP